MGTCFERHSMNMHVIDWSIVVGLVALLTAGALFTRRYAKSVSGFLAADRCGGRYMISVANGVSGVGLITVMYFFQIHYDNGFTGIWWNFLTDPILLILPVTGWVVFRFRQTRAMTMAQFFEMRYSRSFRVFTGFVAFLSGVLNFGIFPSIGARFFIYFCGFPATFTLPGLEWTVSTYAFIMALLLITSVIFTFLGGQISIMFTDFIQGTFYYIAFICVICFLFVSFSKTQMAETLLAAEPGRSLVNPYDLGKEENFNPTFYLIAFVIGFYQILAWQGNAGYNCAAKNAHEAKMANVLYQIRTKAVLPVLYILVPVVVHIYMEHPQYQAKSVLVQDVLKQSADDKLLELSKRDGAHAEDYHLLTSLSVQESGRLLKLTESPLEEIEDSAWSDIPALADKSTEEAKQLAHLLKDKTSEIKSQTRLPLVMGHVLPKGLLGLFCAAMLAAFISTHNTYLHSWGAILVQDVILPLKRRPFKTNTHLWVLRFGILLVAVYVFFFSLYFQHSQRIIMYTTITWSIFVGGAGSVIIGGLYWQRGTTAGAWSAMVAGMVLSILGVFVSQSGPSAIYAAQERPFWIAVTGVLAKIHCDTWFWKAALGLFSWNSQVILFWICATCVSLYVVVSLLSKQGNFSLDKLLHRGKYKRDDDHSADILEAQTIWQKLGFTSDFTRADYFAASVAIIWPLFWFAVFILGTLFQSKIKDTVWFECWYHWLWFMLVLGIVMTVWFTIGGFKNCIDFFKLLHERKSDEHDDGTVQHTDYENNS